MEDTVWFVPFNSEHGQLQSIYQAEQSSTVAIHDVFTVSLERLYLAHGHKQSFLDRMIHRGCDVLILTTSSLGNSTPIERVHYFEPRPDPSTSLEVTDLLSDQVYICPDYSGTDHLYVKLEMMVIDTGDQQAAVMETLQTLASTAGAIFPSIMPYVSLTENIAHAIEGLIGISQPHSREDLFTTLELRPPGSPSGKQLQYGRYVVFPKRTDDHDVQDIDGTSYSLLDNSQLAKHDGKSERNLSYVVLRVDRANEPSFFDSNIQQQVASILTTLQKNQHGLTDNPANTAIGVLTELAEAAYTLKGLQKYNSLVKLDSSTLSPEQNKLLNQLRSRPDLQPYMSQ